MSGALHKETEEESVTRKENKEVSKSVGVEILYE